jgi:hypothetical protein
MERNRWSTIPLRFQESDCAVARLLVIAILGLILLSGLSSCAKDEKPASTKAELKYLVTHAKTASDHHKVAAYWRAEAERYETDAKQHEELAAYYKSSGSFESNDHCEVLVLANRNAVAQARALAASHEQLAGLAGK